MRSIRQNIRTEVLTYGPNEMRFVQETKVRIFSVWNEQLVNKSLIVYPPWLLNLRSIRLLGGPYGFGRTNQIASFSLAIQ